jgi:hypothetical protein
MERNNNQLVIDLTERVLQRAAPDELPLFPAFSEEYRDHPYDRPPDAGGADRAMGFGVAEGAALLTPFVFPVVKEVLDLLKDQLVAAMKEHDPKLISAAVERVVRRINPANQVGPARLTPEQLTQIHAKVTEAAGRLQLSTDQAALLADAVNGALIGG